jgi:uncharacterized membrane protein YbaN (DUF454 family)
MAYCISRSFPKFWTLFLQRILFQMPFSQILETKGFQKESVLKMSSIVMELSYIFPIVNFFWKPNGGRIIILTSQLFGFYIQISHKLFILPSYYKTSGLVSKHTFKGPYVVSFKFIQIWIEEPFQNSKQKFRIKEKRKAEEIKIKIKEEARSPTGPTPGEPAGPIYPEQTQPNFSPPLSDSPAPPVIPLPAIPSPSQ